MADPNLNLAFSNQATSSPTIALTEEPPISIPGVNGEMLSALKSGNNLMILAGILAFISLSLMGGQGKKGKLATGRFGTSKEKLTARKLALKQICKRKRNAVALYIGKPKATFLGSSRSQTIYLPDAQRGIAVCGGPGSGKTWSIINPALRSAIDQGFPVILYDFKFPSANGILDGSSQTEQIVGYAETAGYQINFFAPGFRESDVCNPLDFLRTPTDAETARQLGTVMNRNFRLLAQDKEDPFFGPAGDQLCEAIFMLAKSSPYPDVMMCQAILSMDKLVDRLQAADLDYFIKASFGQLISVGKSEKTVASIIGTANIVFTRFMKPSVLAAFCGQTTLPIDITGKQLLVFGMDRERRDVVGPLLATVLHMIVNRNVSKGRTDPLILALDEVPTLYLPALVNWLNENRSDGLVTLIGFQNIVQLEEVYNKKYKSILGGCATKAIFNPQEADSAKMFSEYLGEEEVHFSQKSHGSSGGKGSTNVSEQDRTRKLFEPSQFLKLPTGRCILISPGHENKQEAAVPINQNVKIPFADIAASEASVKKWPDIRDEFVAISPQQLPTEADLKQRYSEADKCYCLPNHSDL